MTTPKAYPLVFTFPEVIVGTGFVARIELHGRALLVNEADGEVWLYGVQPGGFAGGGKDYAEACREFKKSYLSILFDIAAEASTFEDFRAQVHGIFDAVNRPNVAAWETALASVRSESTSIEGLPSVKAESRPPKLTVDCLEKPSMRPQVNQFDDVCKAA